MAHQSAADITFGDVTFCKHSLSLANISEAPSAWQSEFQHFVRLQNHYALWRLDKMPIFFHEACPPRTPAHESHGGEASAGGQQRYGQWCLGNRLDQDVLAAPSTLLSCPARIRCETFI